MTQDDAPTPGSGASASLGSADAPSNDGAAMLPIAALLGAWDPEDRGPRHRRLAALLISLHGAVDLDSDTLGDRNRRLLDLHRAFIGSPLEARVSCADCGAESEFLLPADAILGLPPAPRDAEATARVAGRRYTFRLPRLSDIDAAAEIAAGPPPRDVKDIVLELCRVDRGGGPIPAVIGRRLAARFEALDPAANVVVHLHCSGCERPLAATADVATFVARALDRLVAELLRDIDTIAAGYAWDEWQIVELPVWRRRRYVELIRSARVAGRPVVAAAFR
jgi:hypothetical protein